VCWGAVWGWKWSTRVEVVLARTLAGLLALRVAACRLEGRCLELLAARPGQVVGRWERRRRATV
jgi:hypothetical protein